MCYFLGAFGVVDAIYTDSKYFKRNIHQEKKIVKVVVPNCFKRATQTLIFFQKKGFVGCPVLSVIQALGVYGSIGVKYIKFQLELHFLFTALCLYNRYIYR